MVWKFGARKVFESCQVVLIRCCVSSSYFRFFFVPTFAWVRRRRSKGNANLNASAPQSRIGGWNRRAASSTTGTSKDQTLKSLSVQEFRSSVIPFTQKPSCCLTSPPHISSIMSLKVCLNTIRITTFSFIILFYFFNFLIWNSTQNRSFAFVFLSVYFSTLCNYNRYLK